MRTLSLILLVWVIPASLSAATYDETDGIVVMEAENTASSAGKWEGKTPIEGYTGKGYIEFTSNGTASGAPNSPLAYVFSISKSGLYYLHMRASREDHGQPKDHSNDCYVRVDGDYGAGPNQTNKHGGDAPLAALRKSTKFYGGSVGKFTWFSGNHLDLGGKNNKRVAVYNFKAGQTYRLVISGRSKYFSVDRIVFRHADVETKKAEDLALNETTGSAGGNAKAADAP